MRHQWVYFAVTALLVSCATDAPMAPTPIKTLPDAQATHRVHRAIGDADPFATLGPNALAALTQTRIHPLPGGAQVVLWDAHLGDVPVLQSGLHILTDRNGQQVAWTAEEAVALLDHDAKIAPPQLDERDAMLVAVKDIFGIQMHRDALSAPTNREDGWRDVTQRHEDAVALTQPGRVRSVLQPVSGRLRHAFQVEIWGQLPAPVPLDDEAHRLVIDAETGTVLDREALTRHAFTYRVWADSTGDLRPLDSPLEDTTPHPTALPDGLLVPYVPSTLISVDGLNQFADPWLDPGDTETRGNNVDAYADLDAGNGFGGGDLRAQTTAPDTFDHLLDPTQEPDANDVQIQSAIVQAFYTTNWLHDWYYDSGFTEDAGNAQRDNYGRGGIDSDRLLVEIQDYNGRNNATMTTPSDGNNPRMQMFLWDPPAGAYVDIDTAGQYSAAVASFGPTDFDVSGPLADPGADLTACTGVTAPVAGAIVVIERGSCNFEDKVFDAQSAGAIGVIIVNDQPGSPPVMGGGGGLGVTIPSLHISDTNGALVRSEMAAGAPNGTLFRAPAPDLDSAFDNTIVAHEWGHYLFGRLIGGCGSVECGGLNEGSADFLALHMALRDTDARDGTFGMGAYASQAVSDDAQYYGLRRFPYSNNPSYNDVSFRHISDGEALPGTHPLNSNGAPNSEVHNSGSVWGSFLFDAYLALQDDAPGAGRTFDETRRLMSDLWVAALVLAPSNPTFLELRDAVIAAAASVDDNDATVIAEAFARRGMGTCATGPTDPNTLTGVVEGFSLAPVLALSDARVDDATTSCDGDGLLDDGEAGELSFTVTNAGNTPLIGAVLDIEFDPPLAGLALPLGSQVVVPDIAPFSEIEVAMPITVDPASPMAGAEIIATLTHPDACANIERSTWLWTEVDAEPSLTETFDFADGWTPTGTYADDIWQRQHNGGGDYSQVGIDFGSPSDTQLQSPPMTISAFEDFTLTLDHRYAFEESGNTWWDGGVIEVRVDGGPWTDVETWVSPDYDGVLTDEAGNVLADREAFSGFSGNWPDLEVLELDFGNAFAGSLLEIRFRIGTDQAVGAEGWEIDSVSVTGVVDPPFLSRAPDGCTDIDGDGFGALLDCDDTDPNVNPDATEICNGRDDDCNDQIDDEDPGRDPAGGGIWYADLDQDGFGDLASPVEACTQPAGTVSDATDCDDTEAAIHPDATEICNGVDDTCNGQIDDSDPALDLATRTPWYTDGDQDGYGDVTLVTEACDQPPGTVPDNTDCDDGEIEVNPDATEVCNGRDDDCDNAVDDADPDLDLTTGTPWYADADGDGYGNPDLETLACAQPSDTVADNQDCDDTDANLNPTTLWYDDVDGDGFGDATQPIQACVQPPATVSDASDCDDALAAVNPSATEICNGWDDDCDGEVDDDDPSVDPASFSTWYTDTDGDGYGDPDAPLQACLPPLEAVDDDTDCDDTDADVNPEAPEICNGRDDDCDEAIDDEDPDVDPAGGGLWYADTDGDGYGDPNTPILACTQPSESVLDDSDCDDTDAAVTPDTVWYLDLDGDGYGDPLAPILSCTQPQDAVGNDTDCDDSTDAIHPDAVEICNGIDDDCDALIDSADPDHDPASAIPWYVDLDGDGFGDPATGLVSCEPPGTDYVLDNTDCSDANAAVNPAADEICNGIDDDCDGRIDDEDEVDPSDYPTWYSDDDGDGYGDTVLPDLSCAQPPNAAANASDCDDEDGAIHPMAIEVCDGRDNDCDTLVDDDDPAIDPTSLSLWFVDSDGDGYGDPDLWVLGCEPTDDAVDDDTDCDDEDPTIHPAADEICNGIDDDCDGLFDEDDDSLIDDDCGAPTDDGRDTEEVGMKPGEGCGCSATGGPSSPWGLLALWLVCATAYNGSRHANPSAPRTRLWPRRRRTGS